MAPRTRTSSGSAATAPKAPRAYVQRARAAQTAEASERLLDAAERLFGTQVFDRVTLQTIAHEASVSVPTLQRRFGSKEGVLAAVVERATRRVSAQRQDPEPGDIEGNLDMLLAHYELEARAIWHLMRQEEDCPPLASIVVSGRNLHRAWVEAAFGAGSRERTDALVAATDLLVWKLLRLDLGRTQMEVKRTMRSLVLGALAQENS